MNIELQSIIFKIPQQSQNNNNNNKPYRINENCLKLIFPNLKSYKNHLNEWKTLTRNNNDEVSSMISSANFDIASIASAAKLDEKIDEETFSTKFLKRFNSQTNNNLLSIETEGTDTKEEDENNDEELKLESSEKEFIYSLKTLTEIENIVNEYDDDEKDCTLNYWFIARKIAIYFEKHFKDRNTVIIVSQNKMQPQISDHVSIITIDRIIENIIENMDVRIYRC